MATIYLFFLNHVYFIQNPAEEGDAVNTTLQAYFFGKKGENKLQYQEFRRWVSTQINWNLAFGKFLA